MTSFMTSFMTGHALVSPRKPAITSARAGVLTGVVAVLLAATAHAQTEEQTQTQTQTPTSAQTPPPYQTQPEPPAQPEPRLVVRGDAHCPSVDMIRAALLAAGVDRETPEQTVTVDAANDRLSLSLGESPAARRELPADRDCAVRAASVALVIAAWSGELASRPSAAPVLTTHSPPLSVIASSRPAKTATHVVELDASGFYSPVWGHEPGIWLGLGRVRREGGVGLRVVAAYQGARDIALDGGTNEVQRYLLGAAVTYRLQRTHLFASGDLGLLGALTHARGVGYETNRGDSAAHFGALADLRGGVRLGDFQLWANARVLGLVRADTVKIQSSSAGVGDSTTMSAWDAQLGVGMGYRFE